MNDILTIAASSPARIAAMSTAELKAEFAKALEITAHQLVYLAHLWRELERRGEDLSHLRSGLFTYMPMIANGSLDPQAVVRFAGNLTALRALANLSLKEQRRLAEDGLVEVVLPRGDKTVVKSLTLGDMPADLIRQTFNRDQIRTVKEQRALLAPRREAGAPQRLSKTINLRLTEVEYEALRRAAQERDVSVPVMIRAALMEAEFWSDPAAAPASASDDAA